MATKLDAFPARRKPGRYPWHEWFDGNTWLLEQGTDFDAIPDMFRCVASAAAKRHGLRVRTTLVRDTPMSYPTKIAIQAIPAEE